MTRRWLFLMLKTAIAWIVTSVLGSHALSYDFKLIETIQNVEDGIKSCRDAGYDGLATASTPEAYTFALAFTYDIWKNQGGIYIGLTFLPGDQSRWSDGTLAASDTPWGWSDPPASTTQPLYARITRVGKLRLFTGSQKRAALCGKNEKHEVREILGTSANGYLPSDARLILAKKRATSYMKCVTLCSQTTECRAATFNFDLHTCTAFGPGNNTLLERDDSVKTFLKIGFL